MQTFGLHFKKSAVRRIALKLKTNFNKKLGLNEVKRQHRPKSRWPIFQMTDFGEKMTHADFMTFAEFIQTTTFANFIQTLLLCVVIFQLYQTHALAKTDYERRKKQATLEFSNRSGVEFLRFLEEFDRRRAKDELTDYSKFNVEDKFLIQRFLAEMEDICTGVNTGIFDYDVLNRLMGNTLVRRHKQFSQYIKDSQEVQRSLYIEFEDVVRRIRSEKR